VLREGRATIAALDRAMAAARRPVRARARSRVSAAALTLALLLGAAFARPAAAADADWVRAFRGATRLTVARLVWSRVPTVAHRSPATGDFIPTVSGTLTGGERRKATDLLLGPGFAALPDCGAYALSALGEMAYAIETEPPGASVLVLFNERRALFFDAVDRVIGSRPLGDDAAPLLRMIQRAQKEDPPRPLPPARDPDAPVGSDSTRCVFVDAAPAPLDTLKAEIPVSMRGARIEGRVVIRALVGPDSTVHDTRVVEPVPFLNDVARAAALRARFRPALCGGKPVAAWVDVPFDFKLR
jgi:TonB family protein